MVKGKCSEADHLGELMEHLVSPDFRTTFSRQQGLQRDQQASLKVLVVAFS